MVEAPVVHNEERHFDVALMRCIVTGKHEKCIRVKLCEVPWNDDGGERKLEIFGQFSEEGLRSLLTDLESAPAPLTLPTPQEIREGAAYQWVAVYRDGGSVAQFQGDEEVPLSLVDFGRVREFWLSPRDAWGGLPMFGLIKGEGFVTKKPMESAHQNLGLPFPDEYQLNYYRRVTISFTNIVGQNEIWPTHVKQVLGWQVGDPEDPQILEIAVEETGDWQIYRKQNVD